MVWYHTYNTADCLFPGTGALREVETPFIGFIIAVMLALPVVLGLLPLFCLSIAGAVYLVCCLLLVLVYPTGGAQRMLIPSVPLLVLAGYLGLRIILSTEAARGWAFAGLSPFGPRGAVPVNGCGHHPLDEGQQSRCGLARGHARSQACAVHCAAAGAVDCGPSQSRRQPCYQL